MNLVKVNINFDNLTNFVNVAQSFDSDINIRKGRYVFDAKSILGITSLDFSNGAEVEIVTSDDDELVRFVEEMKQFM